MRTLLLSLLIGLLSFGLVVNEAAAKRFGGGRSFGVQRSYSSLFSSKPKPASSLNQRSNTNKWGGVLGGLLAGSLLSSLFMGHGLGSGLLSWLIIGGFLFFAVNFFRRRMQPGLQTSTMSRQAPFGWQNTSNTQGYASSSNFSSTTRNFNEEDFLREAKVKFIRLQAAYDQKNLQDLTAFTAPEVFGEIKMQLEERGNEINRTEVMHLNAELLDVSEQVDSTIASVRFTGSIKENDEPVTSLDEIWHFRKFNHSKDWVVGGIQQEASAPL